MHLSPIMSSNNNSRRRSTGINDNNKNKNKNKNKCNNKNNNNTISDTENSNNNINHENGNVQQQQQQQLQQQRQQQQQSLLLQQSSRKIKNQKLLKESSKLVKEYERLCEHTLKLMDAASDVKYRKTVLKECYQSQNDDKSTSNAISNHGDATLVTSNCNTSDFSDGMGILGQFNNIHTLLNVSYMKTLETYYNGILLDLSQQEALVLQLERLLNRYVT